MASSRYKDKSISNSKMNIPLNISTNVESQQKINTFQLDTLVRGQIQLGKKIHEETFKNIKNYSRLGDIQEIADKR